MFNGYPDSVSVCGTKHPVNTDFRIMCRFELAIQKSDTAEITSAVSDFFIGDIPPDIDSAVTAVLEFYLCGKQAEGGKSSGKNGKRCYDYNEDWKYFIAAFRQQYGIDLNIAQLHWWEFSALFAGLTDDTELVKIMQIRCTDLKGISDKKERDRIKKLQERYALKQYRRKHYKTAEERDRAMIEAAKKRIAEAERSVKNGD